METIFKNCLLLLVMLSLNQAVQADSANNQEKLAFSNMYTALSEELDNERGMGGVVDITTLNKMTVAANLSENLTYNNTTGFNIIDNGAFSTASGFNTIIQNSGNSVLIQDATIINVTIMP